MMVSFYRWLATSAGLGLVPPIVWFLIQRFVGEDAMYQLEGVVRVFWPSSFWLMATDGIEGTPRAYAFILMSVAANVLLYSVLGSVVWSVKRFVADRSK